VKLNCLNKEKMERELFLLCTILISINWIFCGSPTFNGEDSTPSSTNENLCPLCEDVYASNIPPSTNDNCDPGNLDKFFSKSITNDSVVMIGACAGTIVWKGFQGWADFRLFPSKPLF